MGVDNAADEVRSGESRCDVGAGQSERNDLVAESLDLVVKSASCRLRGLDGDWLEGDLLTNRQPTERRHVR